MFMGCRKDEKFLWDSLYSSQSIKSDSLAIDGDMNLTSNYKIFWGNSARLDGLADFFQSHFEASGWVDIKPVKLRPTCNNNRSG
jgi:hypothetical protein